MITRLLFFIVVLAASNNLVAEDLSDEVCLDCHGVEGYATPTGEHGSGPMRSLDINAGALRQSLHGDLACVDCHQDIEKLPHDEELSQAVDCVTCHNEIKPTVGPQSRRRHSSRQARLIVNSERYKTSIHADLSIENNANCETCHTAHYVYRSDDPRALSHSMNSPQVCGACHQKEMKEYRYSLHGANLQRPWRGESATCSDCHSSHRISKEELTAHRVVSKSCGDCHQTEVDAYMSTIHGQLAWLGDPDAAKCSNCHRPHDTHTIDDPESMVSAQNKLETCRKCHENANDNFIQYRVHGNTHDFDKYPFMWVTAKIMVGIVLLVLVFFYSHSMLWFYREIHSRAIEWQLHDSKRILIRVKKPKIKSEKHVRRFSWGWRLNHWALALSVMTLVFTGMSVMYADTPWATDLVAAVGGQPVFATIHRTAAVIFMLAVFGHAIAAIYLIRRKPHFDWFGPDSLLPRKKDWHDIVGQIKWFLGKQSEPPLFDRWTYWEKFDYWAVYWGALVIGISGFMLWFSNTIGSLMPGWVLNLASIAHGVEAFLAVATLFVVHFFNNHLRPGKFPLDIVMFTGGWDLEEFKEERPLEYQRLKDSGELEKRLISPPSRVANLISHILGFTLLGIGLTLLVLVIKGFLQGGLV